MTDDRIALLQKYARAASHENPDAPSRKQLRRALRWHELDVVAALAFIEHVGRLDPTRGPMDITSLVHDAQAILLPFYAEPPR